jgi:integrase
MRGHVRKRGKTYAVVYDEGEDESGKRVQRWKSGFKTRKEADTFLTTVLGSIARGEYVEPSKLTLGGYLNEEWLPGLGDEIAPLTKATYENMVTNHICSRAWLKRLPLQAVTSGHIKRLLREMEQQGKSPATRRLARAVVSRALGDAVDENKIIRNPAAAMRRRRGRRAAPTTSGQLTPEKVWTGRELAKFLAHVEGERLYACWRLAAVTGMRRGELLGLRWRCVDESHVSIEEQLIPFPTPGGGQAAFGPPKSERSRRKIAIDGKTAEALQQHREAQAVEKALAGDAYEDDDLVFCDELGRPIPPKRLTDAFKRLRKAAGLKVGNGPHVLRHTAATDWLVNREPVHIVAARIGDTPEVVMRVYAHWLPKSDEDVAARAAERLAALAPSR